MSSLTLLHHRLLASVNLLFTDCWTDHRLVQARTPFITQRPHRPQATPRRCLDIDRQKAELYPSALAASYPITQQLLFAKIKTALELTPLGFRICGCNCLNSSCMCSALELSQTGNDAVGCWLDIIIMETAFYYNITQHDEINNNAKVVKRSTQ